MIHRESLAKNEFRITENEMLSWTNYTLFIGAHNRFLSILWITLGILEILLIIFLSINFINSPLLLLCVCCFGVSLYKLFIAPRIACVRRYRELSRKYGLTEWTRSIDFRDDAIVVTDHTTDLCVGYAEIKEIKEQGDTVIIILNTNVAILFHKSTFIKGTWNDCKRIIEDKMQGNS